MIYFKNPLMICRTGSFYVEVFFIALGSASRTWFLTADEQAQLRMASSDPVFPCFVYSVTAEILWAFEIWPKLHKNDTIAWHEKLCLYRMSGT
jgi:hypothetical protein